MEIILAIVVVAAVILFGALISMGNDRQRKAIDGLREQVVLWAVQDLGIKRNILARDVQVDDPLGWINKVATRISGCEFNLQVVEAFENPHILICDTADGNGKVIFTPHSPGEIRTMKRAKHNRLFQYSDQNPLFSLPRDVTVYECSTLNNDYLFDLELPLAWKGLTGNNIGEIGFIWIYVIS